MTMTEMAPTIWLRHRTACRHPLPQITPPLASLALGAILLVAAVLSFWQLDREGYANGYYRPAGAEHVAQAGITLLHSFDRAAS